MYMGMSSSELFEHFAQKEQECRSRAKFLRRKGRTLEALWELERAEKWKMEATWFRQSTWFRQFCTPTTAPLREYILPKEGCVSVIRTIEWGGPGLYSVPTGRTRKQYIGRCG